ncbi:MAG TPA: PAS domain S-box protein, partial [Thermomicrobiales bacterium]|nr:PAS domain S-box protein [Thermomicrobiales bacterium]
SGIPQGTALGATWSAAVYPDDAPLVREQWEAASRLGEPFEIEYRFRRADGTYRWHIARVAPIPGPDQQSRWWGAIAIDIEERRQARDARKASEARLRDIIANADDIIYSARLDGTIAAVNPAIERVLGYTPDELLGKPLDILIAPDQLDLSHGMLERKLQGDPSSTYEIDAIARDGRRVTLEVNTRLVTPEGQEPLINGVARDISTRRQRIRQAELTASIGTALTSQRDLAVQLQSCAQALVDHLGASLVRVWLTDDQPPSTLTLRTSAGPDVPDDDDSRAIAIGEGRVGQVAARQQPLVSNPIAPTDKEGITAFAVYPIVLADRLCGVVETTFHHAIDATLDAILQSVADTIAVTIDRDMVEQARNIILERERDARVWAEVAESRYRSLFEGVADAILVADDDRRYRDANAAATTLLGYDRDELLQLRIDDVVAEGSDRAVEEFSRYSKDGRWMGELELRRKDGTIVPVEALATVAQLPSGPVYLSAVRDITERKHLQRLERDFLAMVTHDIRTPLTSIKGWLQILQRRSYFVERDRRTLVRTLEQVEKISGLINDLADLVRIEAGQLQIHAVRVDLVSIVAEQIELVQEQTTQHTLRLDAPGKPIEGRWDRQRIGQVLENLLTNAVKYTPQGGEIVTRVRQDGSVARIQVIDPGIGIAPDHLPLLFERFYREGATGAGGLGLGLHITRMLVEAHGGTITAETEPGQGSTFTVTLPIRPRTSPGAQST